MQSSVLELAHQHASAPAFERAVLELFDQVVGCDVAFFSVRGDEARPTTLGFEPWMIKHAAARNAHYARELMPVKRAALAAHGVAVDSQVLGYERMRQAAYFRELARPIGGRHSLLAYLRWRGQVVAVVMLGRCKGTFSQSEIQRVEEVLPLLALARANLGLPSVCVPLPGPSSGWLQRLTRSRVLATRPLGAGTLVVRDQGDYREMVAKLGTSELVWTRAGLRAPYRSGWPYVELFHVAAALADQRRRALFVGCGGAVALHQFARVYPGMRMDVVERESAVLELARSWFRLDAIPNVQSYLGDGAAFIERAAESTWDVAIIDAFDSSEIDARLTGRRSLKTLRRALTPGGTVALNVIGSLADDPALRATLANMRAVFTEVRLLPVCALGESFDPGALRNLVLVGRRPA